MRFRFIEDRRADYPVTIMCEVLGVSPAGYYAWRSRPESRRSAANRHLIDDIKRVHRGACGRYGSPRIHAELKAQGRGASRGQSRLRKFEQVDKWSFCLTTAIIAASRRDHEQTTAPEPHTGFQGEGGACRRQGRPDDSPTG
jgi:hypothetical protein